MDDDKIQMYNELKENILKNIGKLDARQIKDKFISCIESKRTMEKIETVNDLYNILEERDFINEGNLEALQKLLEYLCNNNITDKVDIEKAHISFYKKQYPEYPTIEKCLKCNKDNIFEGNKNSNETIPIPSAPPLDHISNLKEISEIKQEVSIIEKVISEISKEIGEDWRHFAVLLKLKECDITDIKKKYKNNNESAALEALNKWKFYNKKKTEKELIKKLVEALECTDLYYQCDLAKNIKEEYLCLFLS